MDTTIKRACATMASWCGAGPRTTENVYSAATSAPLAYLFLVRRNGWRVCGARQLFRRQFSTGASPLQMPKRPRLSGAASGRRLRPDQSSPNILTVAVGALPRILYWIFVHVRRPLRPGASVGAVCPPDFTVPTALSVVSGRLSQPRTTFRI